MDQLIELLQQIQELAGAGIDALKGAEKASGGPGGCEGGPPEPKGPEEPGGKPEGKEMPADEKSGGRY